MKALSLTQPYASLVAISAKFNETRSRPLAYKGDIAICSTKEIWRNKVPDYATNALLWLWRFNHLFAPAKDIQELYMNLPFGKVLCVVDKFGCVSTDDDNGDDRSLTRQELELGDYGAGRFYYPTRNCRPLVTPIPVRGMQGLFTLPPDVEKAVRLQLK